MTAEKKPRQRRTDADRISELYARVQRDRAKLAKSEGEYRNALSEAHERAKAAAAALPPLEG